MTSQRQPHPKPPAENLDDETTEGREPRRDDAGVRMRRLLEELAALAQQLPDQNRAW